MRGWGLGMIPWKRQQFWFWLAAILIVAGVSALRETTPQTVESNQAPRKPQHAMEVFRLRRELPPVVVQTPSPEIRQNAHDVQNVVFEKKDEVKILSNENKQFQEVTIGPVEIAHAVFSERETRDENKPIQIVQLSAKQIDSGPVEQPAVWLRGTIEAADRVPQIRPRQ